MTRPLLPAARTSATRLTSSRPTRARLSLFSAAMALALGLASVDANALALGRLNVQSALGQPLRAEIDVTQITAAEADGLKVNIASAEAFRAAGVNYNAALSDVQVALQRRADGRYVVRLTGNRALNEPFIDLLIEANSNSTRIVRDYTVLLDPPASRQASAATPIAPTAPQIATAPSSAPRASTTTRRERPVSAVAPAPVEAGVRTGSGDQQVTVQRGDTANKIASAYKPADVSLDQMLVALLRANPDAFIGGNVNRMKAGAVLNLPGGSDAASVPATDARRTVRAQSSDFNAYRRRLAENAPATGVATADRQASGRLQGSVEDRNAAVAAPDKLTISQGSGTARTAEDQLAQSRQNQQSSSRVAELSKNIDDLNKIQAATGAAPAATPPAAAAPAPAPAAPVAVSPAAAGAGAGAATPAAAATGVPAPVAGASAPAGAAPATPAAPVDASAAPAAPTEAAAPAASPVAPAVVAKPPAPAPEQPGFFASLLDNPLMLGGAALVALLVGFLLYRVLGRRREDAGDSVFLESRMPKDSFFGSNGGESVDTKSRGNSVVSSLSYSPSQLDAGDVDPVAEADVYLAYGRDLQAEEILREALRMTPERTAIHLKLLEIHAKRRDLRAYEALATDVHKLTGGSGNDWNRVVDMGKDLDPGNPLYEAGNPVAAAVETAPAAVAAAPAPVAVAEAPPPAFVPSVAPLDFDLDLGKPAPAPAPVGARLPPAPAQAQFAQTMREGPVTLPPVAAAPDRLSASAVDLENDFDTAPGELEPLARPSLNALPEDERTQPATLRAGLPGDSGFIEFDMSALSGLPGRSPSDTEPGRLEALDESNESPHAVKLSLALELQALGDAEGARSLVEEVEAESTGNVKAQAKQMLAQMH
ncbi:MAG: hypothetical protein EOP81_15090 [Variovorax sp.]|nr:MAG: hypothetical protein EOP81_15090 [Variovorax sp.]